MKLDIDAIRKLAESVEKNNLEELSVEVSGTKVVLKKAVPQEKTLVREVAPVSYEKEVYNEEVAVEEVVEESNLESIDSPMTGTYYKAPSPDSPTFVKVGQEVKAGDTLCIVEAMKLMNEVKASKSGRIAKVLHDDGDSIKKGDKLFLID